MPKLPRPKLPITTLAAEAIADFNRQRVKTQKALAERYELENLVTRAECLKRSEIEKGLVLVADAIASRIMAADLPRTLKEDLLKDIAAIKLIPEEVAHAQSRFPATRRPKKSTALAKA